MVSPKPIPEGKDILHMTDEELRWGAMWKFFPQLVPAFRDIGIEIEHGKLKNNNMQAMQGVLSQTLIRGHFKRFVYVAHSYANSFSMKLLTFHFFGNYLIQIALKVAAAIRAVVPRIAEKLQPETARTLSDLFSDMCAPLVGDLVEMAQHQQASFVLDLILELANTEELMQFCIELGQRLTLLLNGTGGANVARRVVDKLKTIMTRCETDDPAFVAAHTAVGDICAMLSYDTVGIARHAGTVSSMRLLVTLVELACPKPGAFWLAEELCKLVPTLIQGEDGLSVPGVQCLNALVNVQAQHAVGPPCHFRDVVCLVALRLKGHCAWIAAAGNAGVDLLASLLKRLEAEQERDWLDYILQELITGLAEGHQLSTMERMTTEVADILSSAVLADSYVKGLLQMTSQVNPDAHDVLLAKVSQRRLRGLQAPEDKYYAPCCIYPSILEDMDEGAWVPPPPPPNQSQQQPSEGAYGEAGYGYSSHGTNGPAYDDTKPEPYMDSVPGSFDAMHAPQYPQGYEGSPQQQPQQHMAPMHAMNGPYDVAAHMNGMQLNGASGGAVKPVPIEQPPPFEQQQQRPSVHSSYADGASPNASNHTSYNSMLGGMGLHGQRSDIWGMSPEELSGLESPGAPRLSNGALPHPGALLRPSQPSSEALFHSHGSIYAPPPHADVPDQHAHAQRFHQQPGAPYDRFVGAHGGGASSAPHLPWPSSNGFRTVSDPTMPAVSNLSSSVANSMPGRPSLDVRSAVPTYAQVSEQSLVESAGDEPWACMRCTFRHVGKQAHFLSCAMCGADRR